MASSTGNRESRHEREGVILSPFGYTIPTPGELAVLRDRAELTKTEVAERLDVDRDTIRHWETGRSSPCLETVKELLAMYRAEIASESA